MRLTNILSAGNDSILYSMLSYAIGGNTPATTIVSST